MSLWLLRGLLVAVLLVSPLPALAAACDGRALGVAAVRAEPPEEGAEVVVRGVVAGRFGGEEALNGFYLQSTGRKPVGLFVYAPEIDAPALPRQGMRVQVSGAIGHYQRRLQLEWVRDIERCGRAELAATPVSLPAREARLRALEDTLVTVRGPLFVTDGHALGRYGVLRLSSGARLYRSGAGPGRATGVRLDDGRAVRDPRPVPYLNGAGTRRAGDRLDGVTGILDYTFDAWRIHPVIPPHFTNANPRAMPPSRAGAWRLVGFNVENYFVTLGGRGARSESARGRQRQRLVAAIRALDADVLALQELENRPAAVRDLVAALNRNAPVGERYAAAAAGMSRGDAVLRNVLLYRSARLDPEAVWVASAEPHDRAPVAALFRDREGREVLVASAHFKSRSGCPRGGDVDRGAGCWNQRRTAQARALAAWMGRLTETPGAPATLLLGDLNAYPGEPPLEALADGGLRSLMPGRVPADERYSYVYDGRAGLLDHALGDRGARSAVRGVTIWHVNADEPSVVAGEGPWRSADHDPAIVDLFARD